MSRRPKHKRVKILLQTCINTQSELTAELSDPKLLGALLNSPSSFFNSKQEGRVTAVVAKARYQK